MKAGESYHVEIFIWYRMIPIFIQHIVQTLARKEQKSYSIILLTVCLMIEEIYLTFLLRVDELSPLS